MTIRKAFSKFLRTSLIGNNIVSSGGAVGDSATKITSGGYDYYVYTAPATDSFDGAIGISTQSRVISGGSLGPSPFGSADILVVAGGAGGGGGNGMGQGGGGGAGGVRYFPNVSISGPILIQVGYGGTPVGSYSGTVSGDGQPSFFGPSYISYGGGGGGSGDAPTGSNGRRIAGQGGSGGGSGTHRGIGGYGWPALDPNYTQAGLGNIPPFSPPQGSNGSGNTTNDGSFHGGGGGSSGAGNSSFPAPINANGGNGTAYTQFQGPVLAPAVVPLSPNWAVSVGTTGLFGGGGGAGRAPGPDPSAFAKGGPGGGGPAGGAPTNVGQPGVDYTGGGGGGCLSSNGSGGKGIIIVRKAL